MASSISFRFDLSPTQLPLQKAYVALEFVDALGGVARGGLGQVSSAGKEERHERLVVVLGAARVAHLRAQFSVSVESARGHRVTERVANQLELFLRAGAEEDPACAAGKEQGCGRRRARGKVRFRESERRRTPAQDSRPGRPGSGGRARLPERPPGRLRRRWSRPRRPMSHGDTRWRPVNSESRAAARRLG